MGERNILVHTHLHTHVYTQTHTHNNTHTHTHTHTHTQVRMNHPFVVRLYFAFQTNRNLYMVRHSFTHTFTHTFEHAFTHRQCPTALAVTFSQRCGEGE